jgi:hypothetical protein
MGLFARRRQSLALTPEAVASVLLDAGFIPAEFSEPRFGEYARPVTEGFHAYVVPVTHEGRVGVSWHADIYANEDPREVAEGFLVAMGALLEQVGYQSEIVAETIADYLVVWVEGDF